MNLATLKMKDQNNIPNNESDKEKLKRAHDLFMESVMKPDASLRLCAHNQNCYNELMQIREDVLEYLKTIHP